MMYKAVIFDFEGTLVSFAWDLKGAVSEVKSALRSVGIYAEENNYAKLYNLIVSKHPEIKSLVDKIYDKYDLLAFENWKLKPETHEVLSKLKVKKAVLSNIGGTLLRKALKKFGIIHYFDIAVGRGDVSELKPSPLGIQLIIRKLNVKAEDILFVGDSISDVEACRKAGIDVAVVEGENKIYELDADYKLNSLSDILTLPIHGL